MKFKIITKTAKQTRAIGAWAVKNIEPNSKKAIIIALMGDLGSGKTTFAQGFGKAMGIKEKILSPTFVVMKKFQTATNSLQLTGKNCKPKALNCKLKSYFYHIDCYRIKDKQELLTLGFEEIISDNKNIVLIEWADRIKKILPKDTIFIKFKFIDKNIREIDIDKLTANN